MNGIMFNISTDGRKNMDKLTLNFVSNVYVTYQIPICRVPIYSNFISIGKEIWFDFGSIKPFHSPERVIILTILEWK